MSAESSSQLTVRILIVEDDLVARAGLEAILSDFGHEIVGIADNAVDALVLFTVKQPDIVICDISLNGSTNGIELVKKLNEIRKCPVLFLTAYTDENMFNQAKVVAPLAFIPKPIERLSLERSVALAAEHARESQVFLVKEAPVDDCLYTRVGNKLRKIYIRDIEFVEVDGKYSAICIGQRLINCKISLKELLEKLPRNQFTQINRNTAINMDMIEDIDMAHFSVKMPSRDISISRTYKDQLLQRINLI